MFTQIATNLPSADYWYSALATLDLFLLALCAVVIIALLAVSVISRLIPTLKINLPQLPLSWLEHRYFWQFLMVLALLVRLPRLLFVVLWYDETYTAAMARVPMNQFWLALAGDVHPPGHYLITKLSGLLFGFSEPALRLPSLLAGLALIWVVYRLTDGMTDRRVARLAAVLVAFSPTAIHYSAEARYPMLLALAVSACCVAIRERKPFLFMLAGAIAPMLHATGVIYAGMLILVYLFVHIRWWIVLWRKYGAGSVYLGSLAEMFLACAITGLSCIAYFEIAKNQSVDVSNGFWLYKMLPLWHLMQGVVMFPRNTSLLIISYAAVIVLTINSIPLFYSLNRWLFIFVICGVPVLLALISQLWQPVYLPRSLLASSLLMLIGWAWLAVYSGNAYRWLILLAFVTGLIGYCDSLVNERFALDKLFAHCEGADTVYTTSTNMAVISLYYAPEGSKSVTWNGGNNQHQTISYESRLAMGFDFTPLELAGSEICVIQQRSYYTTPEEQQRVGQLRDQAYSREIVPGDGFMTFEILWLDYGRD